MILVDTSAWVEFLRDTGSPVCERVHGLLEAELRRLLARGTSIATAPTDYEEAATWYRMRHRHGDTVRKLVDCLSAAVAIRAGLELIQADADFEALARHTPLRLASV